MFFEKEHIAFNGNKFLMGNGYFGVRGTMEEYNKGIQKQRKRNA